MIGSSSTAHETLSYEVPPTPVHVLQEIGINRCVVPVAKLSEALLNAAPAPTSGLASRLGTLISDDLPAEDDIYKA